MRLDPSVLDDLSGAPFGFEMDAAQMRVLLDELDRRLRDRGVAASVYVVGGAAMTLAYGRETMTPDIDAVTTDLAVAEEAAAMADEHHIPQSWLNGSVGMFMPSTRPDWSRTRAVEPGLTIYVAPPRYVLAMKLVAGRIKDRPDIRLLVNECGMQDSSPEDFVDLLRETYPGEGELAHVLNAPGADEDAAESEARYLGEMAIALARR